LAAYSDTTAARMSILTKRARDAAQEREETGGGMSERELEVLSGTGRLRLSDRHVAVEYYLRITRTSVPDVPSGFGTTMSSSGKLEVSEELSRRDLTTALTARKPLQLELDDGRKVMIRLTDLVGGFDVIGPVK
jgi:hypothetical protein